LAPEEGIRLSETLGRADLVEPLGRLEPAQLAALGEAVLE
jgi:hypothetical protein